MKCLCPLAFILCSLTAAADDYTLFQTSSPWSAPVDIGADNAVVYGTRGDFFDRLAGFRARGYRTAMMTGIAWGDYGDYFGEGESFKRDEVQTMANGQLRMHGGGLGYNVPTPGYIEYMKQRVAPAVDAGVTGIFLEEPEYWANTGWSQAFKDEWQKYYGVPWESPGGSVDAQFKASRLKYELYYKALSEVFRFAKLRAKEQGRDIECHVPTHSLINYAHWHIVSPESHLMDIPEADGYIAQVWTGTARTPTRYRGEMHERTFEAAYFEYGQAWAMVRPTGRKVWFLHDPIEDNPNHTWVDYKYNYEATVVASLLWPGVYRYEIAPWPDRVFQGQYPKADLPRKPSGTFIETEREGIPADYATELLTLFNSLNDMKQDAVRFDAGEPGINILVSDTLMFQRDAPVPSDGALGCFYGFALPLIKQGIPAQVVQLETLHTPADLGDTRLLLLSYDGQKPLKPEYHELLASWVRDGGRLLIADNNSDPYNAVKEWWNNQGVSTRTPRDALLESLGAAALPGVLQTIDKGRVLLLDTTPTLLSKDTNGAELLLAAIAGALEIPRDQLRTRNYLRLDRGPYTIAACLDESISETPLVLDGAYINLFNGALPIESNPVLRPGQRGVYVNLGALQAADPPRVLAASSRITGAATQLGAFRFTARGPVNTPCRAVLHLPKPPTGAAVDGHAFTSFSWDEASHTLRLEFPNEARPVQVEVAL